ncbi:transporter substrate-binding domain-containing protein [Blautia hominis]|nr:transporter substrate-binding domain-containing protein [Blautia hominis]
MRERSQVPGKGVSVPVMLALLFWVFLLPCDTVWAEEDTEKRVLKVAFPEVDGFTETDTDGVRHGIVVDYLNEIAKYTGWKYEYINVTGEEMIDNFMAGEYDLMGGTYYLEGMEEYFSYPDYNAGYGKSLILARRNDSSIRTYDWKSMNGKTIGVYENARENIRRLKQFIESNAIDCTIKYYNKDQLFNGNLYPYLESGEIDMLLGNIADDTEVFRPVATFDSQPHYIVTTPDNQDVLEGLNMALEKIADSNPNFAEECYQANFPDSGTASIYINDEERAYIEQKKTVSIAVVENWHPLFCIEYAEGLHNGLIPDVLEEVKKFTGLEFTYVYAESYADALKLVQEGKADMMGAFLGNEEQGAEMNLALTQTYGTLNDIIARNKSVSFPSEGLVGAVVEGLQMPAGIKTEEVLYYPNAADALSAVNRGEADFFYGLSANMEEEIQRHHYTKVVPNTLVNNANDIVFAMKSPAETDLLTVMNKAINSMSSEEKDTLVNQNMISVGMSSLTVVDLLYANPILFITVIAGVFLLVVFLVLMAARSRVRSAKMQASLEKAEAENKAKGEFLSRMSHEIRTPMNAIVGLSDLTCMLKDVPEDVSSNLIKIRESSHYLLRLISDILDMSRIDSGMMTITSEPFSAVRLVDEVQNIMASEARKYDLEFEIHKKIKDDILAGDAVRLKQVLMNLISNAFKFTPAGGLVQLYAEQTGNRDGKAVYEFRVADNGTGISKENQQRIFEAFEQAVTSSAKSQGTGLGLAISRTIVKLMGGELKLKSEPGQGSEFYFTIEMPVENAEDIQEETSEEREGPCLLDYHILLAEDNDLNAEIAQELLKMQGAVIQRARNGKEAVEMFEKSRPKEIRAVLMDIQMPVMNGLEAARAIRKLGREDAVSIPIIAMTANSFKEDVDAAAAAGMDGFVTKPVDAEYLYQVLQKAAASNKDSL